METDRTKEILKKVREVEVRTNRLVEQSLAGRYHSVFKGRGMDFDRVRNYVAGDEIRTIDWNVTARTGEPFIKLFTEERELTTLLLIDLSASADFGSSTQSKRELAAEVGSVLAFSALKNNDNVGLILFTGDVELYIPPRKGRSHCLRLIREILYFEPEGHTTDFGVALDFANRVTPRHAVVFLISDFCLPGNFKDTLKDLRSKLQATTRRHDVIAISTTDPRETSLPDVGLLSIEDAETGEIVQVDTRNQTSRDAFSEHAQAHRTAVRKEVRSVGVDLLELTTGEPYLPTLLTFFKARERRTH